MFVIDEFTSKGFLNVNLYEVPNSVDIWGTLIQGENRTI